MTYMYGKEAAEEINLRNPKVIPWTLTYEQRQARVFSWILKRQWRRPPTMIVGGF